MSDHPLDLVEIHLPAHVPRRLPALRLAGAMTTWLGGIFAAFYVGVPIGIAALGLGTGTLAMLPYSLVGFAAASAAAVLAAVVLRPPMHLDTAGRRDPVIAATLGGIFAWALIHNTSAALLPFTGFGALHLAIFVATNALEMALLGMLVSSFTRSRVVAFGLGAAFQALSMGVALALLL